MARRVMTREVTQTKIKVAKLVVENGVPVVKDMDNVVVIGKRTKEWAERYVVREFGQGTVALDVETISNVYELPLEKFLEVATIKTKQTELELNEDEQTETK